MKKLFCCPALELFCCLSLWKTEFFHRGRQRKSSRAGQQRPISDLNFKFKCFQHYVLDFLLEKFKVTVGGKNHYYTTNKVNRANYYLIWPNHKFVERIVMEKKLKKIDDLDILL